MSLDQQKTLLSLLRWHAREKPENSALLEKKFGIWKTTNWSEYFLLVAKTAKALANLGLKAGDHISILSDNRPEWLYCDLAAQALSASSVGLYQTSPAPDVEYILNHSESKILFLEDQEQADKALSIETELPFLKKIIIFDPRGVKLDNELFMSFDDFIAGVLEDEKQLLNWFDGKVDEMDPKKPAMVIYTSGTTGTPKGAMISNENVLNMARSILRIMPADQNDSVLSYLPLCHVAEKIFSIFLPLLSGCKVHFGESIETVQADLREVSPTVFLGVPRIWEKMHASITLKMKNSSLLKRLIFDYFTGLGRKIARNRAGANLSFFEKSLWFIGDILLFRPLQERIGLRNCRLPVTGAAPISSDLIEWFSGIGLPITEGYGQTECCGVSHFNPPEARIIGSVGKALDCLECVIADDGEILVKGPSVFCGYLKQEEATKMTVDEDSWLHTGDIGNIDEKGYLSITGRKKEIIVTAGGKNLSPEKIENALKLSPYIKEAVSIGDKRKFVSAMIQIDYDSVGDWASEKKITYTSYEDLSQKKEVFDLIRSELEVLNENLARVEQVRKFKIFAKELHQDDGELTPTQKVKRKAILQKYEESIEEIYS